MRNGAWGGHAERTLIESHDEDYAALMPPPTDQELLDELRLLLAKRGKLNASLIEASECTRYPNAYIRRFGSLTAAYELIGYNVDARQRATAVRFRRPKAQ